MLYTVRPRFYGPRFCVLSILRTKIIVTEVLPILNMVKNFDFMYFNFTDFRFYGPNSTLQKFTFSCKFFSILRTYHIKLNKNIFKFLKLNFLHYNFSIIMKSKEIISKA